MKQTSERYFQYSKIKFTSPCGHVKCKILYLTHDFHINSFQRDRTVKWNDYPGMRTIPGNNFFFFFTEPYRDRSYWNFYLVLYFLNKTTLGCKIAKAFKIFYYLLNCCSLKCLTKKAWNFPLHCLWKRNINSQKCSLIKLTNATWGSFFIPQETEVLIWSIFSKTICSKMTKQLCFWCSF